MHNVKSLEPVATLLKRFSNSESRFNQWRSLHQEAMDYSAPQRETFNLHSPGQEKNRYVFDSTAEDGLEAFISIIQSSLVPSWQQWTNLIAGTEIPKDQKEEVDKKLKETTDTLFNNINHSNFDTEITQSFSDLGIGTGAILIEEADFNESSSFVFTNIPLAELYIEKPSRGAVKNAWRKQKIEAGCVSQSFPDAEIPHELQKIIDKDRFTEVEIKNGFIFNEKTKLYNHVVLWQKSLLFAQEFKTKRLIVFRWSVVPGEGYGRGIAIKKLPDIRTANKIKEIILGNAAIQMTGVYTGVSDGLFNPNTVVISPGTVIPVMSNDSTNPTIKDLTPSGNLRIADGLLLEVQTSIRKAFFDNPLGDVSDPVRSATENLLRAQMFLKQSGASTGRLKSEFIEPLISAGIDILSSLGKVPDIKIDGKQVTIKQVSPLAKAESTEEFQSTQLWLSSLMQILPPEVIASTVKVEDLPKKFQQQLGTDPDLIRSKEQIAEIASKLEQSVQQQGQQNDGQQTI